jgi:hypothetical protein
VTGRWPTFSAITPPVVHCFRGDDAAVEVGIDLGQWPTWQTIPKENRSFTIG